MNHLFFRVAESYFDVDYKGADDVRLLMLPLMFPDERQQTI